jgi:hypothetical protein
LEVGAAPPRRPVHQLYIDNDRNLFPNKMSTNGEIWPLELIESLVHNASRMVSAIRNSVDILDRATWPATTDAIGTFLMALAASEVRSHRKLSIQDRPLKTLSGEGKGVVGKRILVIGSETPWMEAIFLASGAQRVVTLEYRKIDAQHPQARVFFFFTRKHPKKRVNEAPSELYSLDGSTDIRKHEGASVGWHS